MHDTDDAGGRLTYDDLATLQELARAGRDQADRQVEAARTSGEWEAARRASDRARRLNALMQRINTEQIVGLPRARPLGGGEK